MTHVGFAVETNFPMAVEVRTRRVARSLDRDDHDVTVFARNTATDAETGSARSDPPTEDIGYATVRRFSWLFGTPLGALVTLPVPVNPFWVVWLVLECRRRGVDALVVGGIRVSIPGIVAARLLGIPVVVDVRENYPEWARMLPKETLAERIQTNPWLVGLVESLTVRLADEVWVVVEERRDQLLADGAAPATVRVVGNTPDLAESEYADVDPEADRYDWPGFALVYMGWLQELRGLDTLIEALPHVIDRGEEVYLVLGGEGDHKETLRQLARELEVDDYVVFVGWVEPDRGPEFLASADVGVIPHRVSPFTNTTVPNKLFDYMMVGLPVLATAMRPVERIVEAEACGRIVPPDASPEAVADAIVELKRADLSELAENGRRAVRERYNWSHDAAEALASIERLTGQT
jgi:glycosyltransferase involved in cell wall biosynthesis